MSAGNTPPQKNLADARPETQSSQVHYLTEVLTYLGDRDHAFARSLAGQYLNGRPLSRKQWGWVTILNDRASRRAPYALVEHLCNNMW
jgi:hypothetical protein